MDTAISPNPGSHWEAGHPSPNLTPSAPTLAALSGNVFDVFASFYEHNQPASCVLVTTSAAKHLDALAGTRGTDSWLDGTDIGNKFGSDLLLLFKVHGIWSVDFQENY